MSGGNSANKESLVALMVVIKIGNIMGKLKMAKTAGLFFVEEERALFKVSTFDIAQIPRSANPEKVKRWGMLMEKIVIQSIRISKTMIPVNIR